MTYMKITDKEGRVKFIQGDEDPEPLSIEEMIERDINKKEIKSQDKNTNKETLN